MHKFCLVYFRQKIIGTKERKGVKNIHDHINQALGNFPKKSRILFVTDKSNI